MATNLHRRQRRLYGMKIAIVAGILVMLIGLYFILGISGQTNRKNAECTEEIIGTIVDSTKTGSSYSTTIQYTPGYEPMTVTLNTKKQYDPGTEIPMKYHPTSFSRIYVEGISPTGKDDVVQGMIFFGAGAVLVAVGFAFEKRRKGKQ